MKASYLFVRHDEVVAVSGQGPSLTVHWVKKPWTICLDGRYIKVLGLANVPPGNQQIDLITPFVAGLANQIPNGNLDETAIWNTIQDLRNDHGRVYVLTSRGVVSYRRANNVMRGDGSEVWNWGLSDTAVVAADPRDAVILARSANACKYETPVKEWVEKMRDMGMFLGSTIHVDEVKFNE